MQKRQAEQDEQIAQHKQTVTMLIIDKKMMKLKIYMLKPITYHWYDYPIVNETT